MIVKHFCMNIIVCPDQYINPVMISYMPRVTHVVNVCGLTWFNKRPDIIIWQIQLAYSYHFVRYFYRKRSSIKFSLGQLLTPTSTLGRSRLLDSFAVASRLPVQERKMILGAWYSASQEGWEGVGEHKITLIFFAAPGSRSAGWRSVQGPRPKRSRRRARRRRRR